MLSSTAPVSTPSAMTCHYFYIELFYIEVISTFNVILEKLGSTIGIGVVGLGRGFTLTLPALRSMAGAQLRAAFDVRPEARASFTSDLGGRTYDSLEGLLEDPEVDALYLASPHELHAMQAIAAARAGKHVLVEKPMALSLEDGRAMVDAARLAGVALLVGPSHGFDAPVQRVADLISSGALGAVRFITTFNFTDFMYRPRRPEELDPKRGGGVVYSQAAHQFDVVRRIIGQPVIEITAITSTLEQTRPHGAYTALVRFADGIVASLTYSGYAHYDSDELMDWVSELGRDKDPTKYGQARKALAGLTAQEELAAKQARTYGSVAGSTAETPPSHNEHFGFLLVSCDRADLKVLPDGIWIYGDQRREFLPVPAPTAPRAAVISEFLSVIRGDRQSRHDGEWGLTTMACCAALARSSATGRAVRLDEIG